MGKKYQKELKYFKNKPKYIVQRTDTIEIYIQGGIVGAGKVTNIFIVNSVMAVPTAGKIKREDEKTRATLYEGRKNHPQGLFSELLKQEVEEQQEAPANCRVVTYGQDSRLHTFEYQKREYHY